MKVALIGNQNSGKTTLFNCLIGMNAKIGNWPGVTIEKKTGKIKGTDLEITDLHGIYSLSPYSTEEEISRKFIFEENPEVIINIVDSTSLERSLYLTTQLMELDNKVIVALNMADMLEKKGISIDVKKLEILLGVKVYKISALRGTGINELINEVKKSDDLIRQRVFDSSLEDSIELIKDKIESKHRKFVSVKLLEKDERFKNKVTEEISKIIEKEEKNYDTDFEEIIATERYNYIEKVKEQSVIQNKHYESISDKLDKVFLNKFIAFPIFIIIMFLIYYLSVGIIGSTSVEWVGLGVDFLSKYIGELLEDFGT